MTVLTGRHHRFIDRTGEIHAGLKILKELGGGKVACQCLICGSTKDYLKGNVVCGDIKSCGCKQKVRGKNYNFVDKTGEIHGNLKIIKELGKERIIAKCLLCGSEKEYRKCHVDSTERQSCGCQTISNGRAITDRTGEIHGGLQIIEELGGNKVMARCLTCKSEKKYTKGGVVWGNRKSCGCKTIEQIKIAKAKKEETQKNRKARFIDRTGEVHGKLKIVKELRGNKVIAQCLICNTTKEYRKSQMIQHKFKSCGCMPLYTDRTGETFKNLKILRELGGNKVIAKCLLCESEKEYFKNEVVSGRTKACGCRNFKDRTGQTFNSLKILKELRHNKVTAECLLCGSVEDYLKNHIVSGLRKSCGCKHNIPIGRTSADETGNTFNNLKIIKELGSNRVLVKCLLCDSEKEYAKTSVTTGRVNSCGCDKK